MVFKKTFSGKEPDVPAQFAPSAGDTELVSRVGVYDAFSSSATINVAWGGNTNAETGGVYDKRNILIHHIKVTNEDFDKQKEIHFWSNDDATGHTSGHDYGWINYLFNIPMAITKDDADGKVDTIIDFPIPLLVVGGCRIAIKNINGYSSFDYDARVEICYSVLDGTPDSASFDELKYKYLSAFSSSKRTSEAEYAVQPDTASTEWVEDIEIWGGMVMNYKNAVASAAVAKTYVTNGGNASCLSAAAISSHATLTLDGKVGTIVVGDKISGYGVSGTPTVSSITAQTSTTATIVMSATQTIGNNVEVRFNSKIVATISVIKGATNAITLDYPVGIDRGSLAVNAGSWPTWSGGTLPSLPTLNSSGGSINFPGYSPPGYGISFPTISLSGGSVGSLPSLDSWPTWPYITGSRPNLDWASEQDPSEVYTWSLFQAGSDTQVTFYPFPVYCAGNDAGTNNMKVHTGATSNNDTRCTWFYRPVNAQGIDHGWV